MPVGTGFSPPDRRNYFPVSTAGLFWRCSLPLIHERSRSYSRKRRQTLEKFHSYLRPCETKLGRQQNWLSLTIFKANERPIWQRTRMPSTYCSRIDVRKKRVR